MPLGGARPSVEHGRAVDAATCAEAMAPARAVLLPSAWEETFGLAAVEAMALGVPPVAAGHGSFPELITPGADGALFRPGDPGALASAMADARGSTRSATRPTGSKRADLRAAIRPRL